jgi:hypothetical protein
MGKKKEGSFHTSVGSNTSSGCTESNEIAKCGSNLGTKCSVAQQSESEQENCVWMI